MNDHETISNFDARLGSPSKRYLLTPLLFNIVMFICWSPSWISVTGFEMIKLQRTSTAAACAQGSDHSCDAQSVSHGPQPYCKLPQPELILACWLSGGMLDVA